MYSPREPSSPILCASRSPWPTKPCHPLRAQPQTVTPGDDSPPPAKCRSYDSLQQRLDHVEPWPSPAAHAHMKKHHISYTTGGSVDPGLAAGSAVTKDDRLSSPGSEISSQVHWEGPGFSPSSDYSLKSASEGLDLNRGYLTTFDMDDALGPKDQGNVFFKFFRRMKASVSSTNSTPSVQQTRFSQSNVEAYGQLEDSGITGRGRSLRFQPSSLSSDPIEVPSWFPQRPFTGNQLTSATEPGATPSGRDRDSCPARGIRVRSPSRDRSSDANKNDSHNFLGGDLASDTGQVPSRRNRNTRSDFIGVKPSSAERMVPGASLLSGRGSNLASAAVASAKVTATQATGRPVTVRTSKPSPALVRGGGAALLSANSGDAPQGSGQQAELTTIVESGRSQLFPTPELPTTSFGERPRASLLHPSTIYSSRRVFGAVDNPVSTNVLEHGISVRSAPLKEDVRVEWSALSANAFPPAPGSQGSAESILDKTRSLQNAFKRLLGDSEADSGNSRTYWMQDDLCKQCYECQSTFTTFRRRHHCRICGQIFCHKCASTIIPGERFGFIGHIRVCNYCVGLMKTYQEEASGGFEYSDYGIQGYSSAGTNVPGSYLQPSQSPTSPAMSYDHSSFDALRKIFSVAGHSIFPARSRTVTPGDYPAQRSPVPFRNNINSEIDSNEAWLDPEIASYIEDDSDMDEVDAGAEVLVRTTKAGGTGSGKRTHPCRRNSEAAVNSQPRKQAKIRSPRIRKGSKRTSFHRAVQEESPTRESDISDHTDNTQNPSTQKLFSQVLMNLIPAVGFSAPGCVDESRLSGKPTLAECNDGDRDEGVEESAMQETFLTSSLERSHLSMDGCLASLSEANEASLVSVPSTVSGPNSRLSRRNSDGHALWRPNSKGPAASVQTCYGPKLAVNHELGYRHSIADLQSPSSPAEVITRRSNVIGQSRPRSTGSFDIRSHLAATHTLGSHEEQQLRYGWRSPSPMGINALPPSGHNAVHSYTPDSPTLGSAKGGGWRKDDPRYKHLSDQDRKRRRSFSTNSYSRSRIPHCRISQLRNSQRHDLVTDLTLSKHRSAMQLRTRSKTTNVVIRGPEGLPSPIRSLHNLRSEFKQGGVASHRRRQSSNTYIDFAELVNRQQDALLNCIGEPVPATPGPENPSVLPAYAYFHYHDTTGVIRRCAVDRASLKHITRLLRQMLERCELLGEDLETWESVILKLTFTLCHQVQPDVRNGDDFDICQYVKFKKVPTGNPRDSRYVRGIVCSKNLAHKRMSRTIKDPRILLLTFALEYHRVENQLISIEPVLSQEREYLRILVSRILALNPSVILVEKTVSRVALEYLMQADVAVAFCVSPTVIRAVARCTQADVISSMDKLALDPVLGSCGRVYLETHVLADGQRKAYMFFDGCEPGLGGTVVLRGSSTELLARLKRICQLMAYVIYNLKLETCVLRDMCLMQEGNTDGLSGATRDGASSDSGASEASYIPLQSGEIQDSLVMELNELDRHISPYKTTLISASPEIRFPPPYLLLRARNELSNFLERRRLPQRFEASHFGGIEWDLIDLDWEVIKAGIHYKFENEDVIDPFAHQNILVMFSNSLRSPMTMPCQPPSIQVIEYYRDNDVPLGQFVEEICYEGEYPCHNKLCDKAMRLHCRSYAHGSRLVTVTIDQRPPLVSAEARGEIDAITMWTVCKQCSYQSSPMLMSEETWKLSLGKYLELSFYRSGLSGKPQGVCSHDVFQKHDKFFGFHGLTVKFETEVIPLYDVVKPPVQIAFRPEPYIAIKCNEVSSILKQITKFFDAVQEKLKLYETLLLAIVNGERIWFFQERLEDLWDRAILERIQLLQFLLQKYRGSDPLDTLAVNVMRQVLWKKVTEWSSDLQDLVTRCLTDERAMGSSGNVLSPSGSTSFRGSNGPGTAAVGSHNSGLLNQIHVAKHKRTSSLLNNPNSMAPGGLAPGGTYQADYEEPTSSSLRRRYEGVSSMAEVLPRPARESACPDSIVHPGSVAKGPKHVSTPLLDPISATAPTSIIPPGLSAVAENPATARGPHPTPSSTISLDQTESIQKRLTTSIPQLTRLFTEQRESGSKKPFNRFLFRHSLLLSRLPPVQKKFMVLSDAHAGTPPTTRLATYKIYSPDDESNLSWGAGDRGRLWPIAVLSGLDPPPFCSWYRHGFGINGPPGKVQDGVGAACTKQAVEKSGGPDLDANTGKEGITQDSDPQIAPTRNVTETLEEWANHTGTHANPQRLRFLAWDASYPESTTCRTKDQLLDDLGLSGPLIDAMDMSIIGNSLQEDVVKLTLFPKPGSSPTPSPRASRSNLRDKGPEGITEMEGPKSFIDHAKRATEETSALIEFDIVDSISSLTSGSVYRSCMDPVTSRRLSMKYNREWRQNRKHPPRQKETKDQRIWGEYLLHDDTTNTASGVKVPENDGPGQGLTSSQKEGHLPPTTSPDGSITARKVDTTPEVIATNTASVRRSAKRTSSESNFEYLMTQTDVTVHEPREGLLDLKNWAELKETGDVDSEESRGAVHGFPGRRDLSQTSRRVRTKDGEGVSRSIKTSTPCLTANSRLHSFPSHGPIQKQHISDCPPRGGDPQVGLPMKTIDSPEGDMESDKVVSDAGFENKQSLHHAVCSNDPLNPGQSGSSLDAHRRKSNAGADSLPESRAAASIGPGTRDAEDSHSVPPLPDPFDESYVLPVEPNSRQSLIKTVAKFLQTSLSPSSLREPLESPFSTTEHVFLESTVIVREDEPSSIVAFSLSTQDYCVQLHSRREHRANLMRTRTEGHTEPLSLSEVIETDEPKSMACAPADGSCDASGRRWHPPPAAGLGVSNKAAIAQGLTGANSARSLLHLPDAVSQTSHSAAASVASSLPPANSARSPSQGSGTFMPPRKSKSIFLETVESHAAIDENAFASSRSWKPRTTATMKTKEAACPLPHSGSQASLQGGHVRPTGSGGVTTKPVSGTSSVNASAEILPQTMGPQEGPGGFSTQSAAATSSATSGMTSTTSMSPAATLGGSSVKLTTDAAADFTDLDQSKLEENLGRSPETHIRLQFVERQCKIYCTVYFAEQFDALRRNCGVEGMYIQSLARCIKWDASGGKSGSTFLKTMDDRFVVKELSRSELDGFVKFAPSYFAYMTQAVFHDLPTALAKLYGVYRIGFKNVTTGKSRRIDVLVMENLFYGTKIDRIFDLKGSLRNRHVQMTGRQDQVLLDQNLIEIICTSPLFVREHSKRMLWASVWNDTLFLSKLNVMDYSLLVGLDRPNGRLVVGIVDFVRMFTWDKKLESWVKVNGLLGRGGKEPTIVSPKQYKIRFREAMERYFLMVPDKFCNVKFVS